MTISKKSLFSMIDGKEATYGAIRHRGLDVDAYITQVREDLDKQIEAHNSNLKEGERKASYEFKDNVISMSNGQVFFMPRKPRTGKISVNSSYITVAGVRISKKDIVGDSITETGFETVNGSYVTF